MNRVILTGRLTKDVEKKTSANGTEYVRFSIAVDKYAKDKDKKTIFVNCMAFGHSANFLNAYCHKGSKVMVDGELDISIKEMDDGTKREFCTVMVFAVEADKPQEQKSAPAPVDTEPDMPFEM